MHRAAQLGFIKNLKWLVENGADISASTAPAFELAEDGSASLSLTPVHVAATYGQVEALTFLHSAGADLAAKVPGGRFRSVPSAPRSRPAKRKVELSASEPRGSSRAL